MAFTVFIPLLIFLALTEAWGGLDKPDPARRFVNVTTIPSSHPTCQNERVPCSISPASFTDNTPATSGGAAPSTANETSLSASFQSVTTTELATSTVPVNSFRTTSSPTTYQLLTTLPTEAVILTLTGVTYTDPVYITTTSPGGEQPTVVPVIIPFVGPPRICFGCFSRFPPDIEIRVPEFCIQLFGLKIGNCPPPEQGSDGKDDSDDKSPPKTSRKAQDTERETKTDSYSSTASTSSCTTIVTATHKSVFCSITRDSKSVQNLNSIGCVTSAYTTITGCSIAASATTVTTTQTAAPTHPICEPATCGSGTCLKEKRSLAPAFRKLAIRGNPAEGEWPDPSDYAVASQFLPGELRNMELNPGSIVGYKPKTVDIMIPDERTQDYYMTTSTWVAFKDNVEAVGLRGMFGCTAVIFVSRRGAWVGHFWESNFQSDTVPEEEFEFRILHEPKQGYREGNWKHQYHEYGWAELGFHPNLGDPGVMFGNKDDKYYEADLRVFIITPRPRGKYYDENHVLLPDDVIHDINRNAGQLQFPGKIKRLSQEIKEVYGEDTKIEVIDYAAKLLKKEDMDLAMENKLTGAQIFHLQADSDFKEARGKLLLQYRPAKTCADLASWRLWVENQGIGGRTASWVPESLQVRQFHGKEGSPLFRRQECPNRILTKATMSNRATSVTAEASSSRAQGSLAVTSPLSQNVSISAPPIVSVTLPTPNSTHSTTNSTSFIPSSRPSPSPAYATNSTETAGITTVSVFKTVDVYFSSITLVGPSKTVTIFSPTTSTTASARKSSASDPWVKSSVPPITTKAAPPPPPPPPKPTDVVMIVFEHRTGPAVGGTGTKWNMFSKKANDPRFNICAEKTAGYTLKNSDIWSLDNIPWAPGFKAKKEIFGRKNCKYMAESKDQAGKFSCQGVPEFDCIKDPYRDNKLAHRECTTLNDDITYIPRIACWFPPT